MGRCSGSLKSALPKLTCQTSAPARSVFAMKAELLPAGPRTVAEMNSTSDVENSDRGSSKWKVSQDLFPLGAQRSPNSRGLPWENATPVLQDPDAPQGPARGSRGVGGAEIALVPSNDEAILDLEKHGERVGSRKSRV